MPNNRHGCAGIVQWTAQGVGVNLVFSAVQGGLTLAIKASRAREDIQGSMMAMLTRGVELGQRGDRVHDRGDGGEAPRMRLVWRRMR